jgi:2-octaprenyl-6-methoxyphenol hydroxylase
VVTRLARAMTARRTALMAEAAHVVPPIGAQGLNMSLADLAASCAGARAPRRDRQRRWLRAYARARERDVRVRALGIDALNRASQAPLGPLRALGVAAFHDLAPVRRALMRLGLG